MPNTRQAAVDQPVAAREGRSRRAGRRRPVLGGGLFAAVAVLLVLVVVSITVGSVPVPLGQAFHAFTAFDPTDNAHLIVRDLRLPRTIVGLLAGAALGLAGGVMQGLARNPSPTPGSWASTRAPRCSSCAASASSA
ncbi:hypothetical protein GCM10029964_069590 [Kibdelosporangium lantanae]